MPVCPVAKELSAPVMPVRHRSSDRSIKSQARRFKSTREAETGKLPARGGREKFR